MAIISGAIWRPIDPKFLPGKRKTAHNRMNVHITAGLTSPFNFFNSPGKASSECCVFPNGTFEQYIDSEMQGEGDYQGNDATHAVENIGMGNGPLTPEQVATNAYLFKWYRDNHGIANKIATSSQIGEASKGLSWHRLGIDGNFPNLPSPLAGRLQRGGGMFYSTSRGKICPGDAVILQIPEIFRQSQSITTSQPIIPMEEEMRLIQGTGRGISVIGPGYYLSLTPDQVIALQRSGVSGPVVLAGIDFDNARAAATAGIGVQQLGIDIVALADTIILKLQSSPSFTAADIKEIAKEITNQITALTFVANNA